MKTAFSFFSVLLFCCTGFQLSAQSQTNLHLDVEYYLPPISDTVASKETFFRARFSSDFSGQGYEQLQVISAKRVFAQLGAGHQVNNYSAPDIGPAFYGGMEIRSCLNSNPGIFTLPADKIIPNNPAGYLHFSLQKNGNASDDWKLTVLPDYRFQTSVDTALVLSKNGKKFIPTVVPQFLDPKKSALLFVETWNFNPVNGQFRKNIHQLGYMEMLNRNGENLGYRWTACLDNADTIGIQKQDVLFRKDVVTDVAMSYTETRLAYDSLTWHFTGADGINDMANQMGNVSQAQRTQFLAALMSYAFAHPENVYPVSAVMKIDSLHPFGKTENLMKLFAPVYDSSIQIEDMNHPGTFVPAVLKTEIIFNNVYGLRFYEDWYYDPKDFVIKKRVKGIGLLMVKPDQSGTGATIQDERIYIKVF